MNRVNDPTGPDNLADPKNSQEARMIREYVGRDLPRLAARCASIVKSQPEETLNFYATLIADESNAADTTVKVARSLAIDDDFRMRAFAARVLHECQRSDPLMAIAQWLATDQKEIVSTAAFNALGQWLRPGSTVYHLSQKLLQGEFIRSRQAAANILAHAGSEPWAVDLLLPALIDPQAAVRQSAAFALGQLGDQRAITTLEAGLEDEDWTVRGRAALALGRLHAGDHVLKKLQTNLQNKNWPVRQSAAQMLGQLSDPRAVEALAKALHDKNERVRESAALALGQIGDVQAVEPLLATLQDENWLVRESAARALGQLGDPRALEPLLAALKDEFEEVREKATRALGHLGNALIVKDLIGALKDRNELVRRSAARALGQLGDPQATEPLIEAMSDRSEGVQRSAARALGQVGRSDEGLFKRLENWAKDKDPENKLRYSACVALNSLVATSPERVFKVARPMLKKPSKGVADEYRLSLEMIGRCAFLDHREANELLFKWAESSDATERAAAAALLGEMLPLKWDRAAPAFERLARDSEWIVREVVAMPLARRGIFHPEAAALLRELTADEEIAVLFAAAAALEHLTGERETVFTQPRLRRFARTPRRSHFLSQWLFEIYGPGRGGFTPFPERREFFQQLLVEDLLLQPESLVGEEKRTTSPLKQEKALPRRREVSRTELRQLLIEFNDKLFNGGGPQLLTILGRMLHLMPEPLIFYAIYKQAPERGRAVCRLFYELASLVEKAETSEFFGGREEAHLRRQSPKTLERLARGFSQLPDSPQAQAYSALFRSLSRLLPAASLTEIPLALAAGEQELLKLSPLARRQMAEWGDDALYLGRLTESIKPLGQYSEEAPISLRSVPLFEAISKLEDLARTVSLEGLEPYRTILLQLLSNWRALLRLEIRRLDGEARLKFSTLDQVTAGETIAVLLQIENHGPAPATNLRVKLAGQGLSDIEPSQREVTSLSVNNSETILFTARSDGDNFIAEFTVTYDDLLETDKQRTYTASVAVRTVKQHWSYIESPYSTGNPAPDQVERLFVGREDIINFIKDNLIKDKADRIIVLYGHRRSGKTWTLLHLKNQLPDTYLPVYIDMQGIAGVHGVPALLQNFAYFIKTALDESGLLDQTHRSTLREPDAQQYEQNHPLYFNQFLRDVQRLIGGRKLIWLFDEFEALADMVGNHQLPASFLGFLRHLMQFGRGMSFIFAGAREMSAEYWSVFFNIAIHRRVGVLNDANAEKLIVEPLEACSVKYDRFAVPLIKQLTGNHPYFIQLLCHQIVAELNARRLMLVNAQIIEAAAEELVITQNNNLKYYWEWVPSEDERAVAGTVRELMRRSKSATVSDVWKEMNLINVGIDDQDVIQSLKSLAAKDILEKDTFVDTYKFKIGLVERYIGAHVPYRETQGRIGRYDRDD